MSDYKLGASTSSVTRRADGATVPNDSGNHDWVAYQLWLAEGNTPDPHQSADEMVAAAKQTIADERFIRETAGTIVGGVAVFTDRTTQMKLTGAAIRAQRDTAYTVNWKQSDGTYVELNATQLIAIGDAVGDYVQACYDRESVVLDALMAGTYTDAMLSEGWP